MRLQAMFAHYIRKLFLRAIFARFLTRYARMLLFSMLLLFAIAFDIREHFLAFASGAPGANADECVRISSQNKPNLCVRQNPHEDSFRILYYIILWCMILYYITLSCIILNAYLNAGSGRRLHSKCHVISSLNLLQKDPEWTPERDPKWDPSVQ